ncbi:hypothetical protein [Chitinimonas sp. BJB300]|uniref:hypothetical protein n=1 Tax=Chitinimonas sp. BJB300 TaxID=1559339 RepID=UPI000C0EB56A|nr:hypothetical protein [Chitinimonas sp. BJB300]PHV13338.1 hypothetical protein CSQ89_00850 [Chitinimonas sp. BJB300]TSJ85255.1 hypothetical protein FG002_017735 [Chitinimonas sp. BJB300]
MITLLIPSLRLANQTDQPLFDPTAELALPGLTSLLGRGHHSKNEQIGAEQWLRQQFQAVGVSAAALTLMLDFPTAQEGYWLRADPVHLRADRDRALLFDASALALQQQEADQLVASLNHLYADDGFRFMAATPSRWYVRLPRAMDCMTTPLAEVLGRDIRPCLPSGPMALNWHRFLNEVQMLLYNQAVNDEREARGSLAANSVWLWGEGRAPEGLVKPTHQLYANDALARGMALASGVAHADLPQQYSVDLVSDSFIVLDSLVAAAVQGDIYTWRDKLMQLEIQWFQPILQAWRQGQLGSIRLVLFGDQGTITVVLNPADRWKFWRTPLALAQV